MSYAASPDLKVEIDFGGTQDGTPNFSGSYTNITCPVDDYNYDGQTANIDLAGRCDTDQAIRVLRFQDSIEVVVKVPLTGKIFSQSDKGKYVRLRITPYTGGTAEVYDTVITAIRDSSPFDQKQTQSVTFKKGAA